MLMPEAHPKFVLEPDAFASLRSKWGNFHNQADSHEFLTVLLEWACLPKVDVSWQRRMLVLEQIQIRDYGCRGTPPTLAASVEKQKSYQLQTLINDWHTYCGMQTCFTTESELLCVHIDRFANSSGAVARTDWTLELPESVALPFWTDPSLMQVTWQDYRVVAVLLHAGQDRAGHLQAGLRTPEGFFTTDNGCIAQASDPTLSTRLQDIVLVWFTADRVFAPSRIAPPQWGKDDLVHRLAVLLHQDRPREILEHPKLLQLLRTSCGACGCLLFSAATTDAHFKEHHPGLWLELSGMYRRVEATLKCQQIPCEWCQTSLLHPVRACEMRDHHCQVALGAAICQLHHRFELQPMSTMFSLTSNVTSPEAALAPSFEAWLNDTPEDEFVLPRNAFA